jgi:protein-tyrosine phosphatase
VTTPPELASWVTLDGCFNFRDLGGYATSDGRQMKTGHVFRSDGLQELSEADLDLLCGEMGLGTVIDLRSDEEVSEVGCGAIAERTTIHHVPLFKSTGRGADADAVRAQLPSDMGGLYFLMLTAARAPIVDVVKLLARSEAPAVFHCAAGKDRTGVISALLLSLLDVPESTIVADYAFSRQNIDRINDRLWSSESYQRLMDTLPDGAYDADPAAMQSFLEKVRSRHGSFSDWAEDAGLDGNIRERLRERLLR